MNFSVHAELLISCGHSRKKSFHSKDTELKNTGSFFSDDGPSITVNKMEQIHTFGISTNVEFLKQGYMQVKAIILPEVISKIEH